VEQPHICMGLSAVRATARANWGLRSRHRNRRPQMYHVVWVFLRSGFGSWVASYRSLRALPPERPVSVHSLSAEREPSLRLTGIGRTDTPAHTSGRDAPAAGRCQSCCLSEPAPAAVPQ